LKQKITKKILYFVTEDWYFCSHRLELARAAKRAGFDIIVVTRVLQHGDKITAEGFKLLPIDLMRRGRNPWREIKKINELVRIYRRERPDIVHHVALKPVLYGSLAAHIARIPAVVNALAGLGYVFTSSQRQARLLRPFILLAYRLLLNRANTRVIVQNPDDLNLLVRQGGLDQSRTALIRGSGVDTNAYFPTVEPKNGPIVVFASRMLWDKGVGEFAAAARLLRDTGVNCRFVLVGDGDSANPASVPTEKLLDWQHSGVVEWWGRRDDMPNVFSLANIVCLPSYREGLPKVLIEAAACGRAIVASDVPGCREIVRHGENGLLVPVRDAEALAAALRELIDDPALRQQMGIRGREIAEAEFSIEKVAQETIAVYRSLLV
jgi:glycosyltransferase involved in cell wall biosynthesis